MSHVPYGADSLLIKSPRWARTASAASPRTDKSLVGHPEGAGRFMSHERSDAANSYPCQPVPDQPPQDSQRFNPTAARVCHSAPDSFNSPSVFFSKRVEGS